MFAHLEYLLIELERAGLEPLPMELAETLWLAVHISTTAHQQIHPDLIEQEQSNILEQATELSPTQHPTTSSLQEPPETRPLAQSSSEQTALYPSTPTTSGQISARPFRSPAVPSLSNALALGRALRPLTRKVASRTRYCLDEEATAEHLAEQRMVGQALCIPTLNPARERCFELALIIDQGDSMRIWQPVLADLRRLLTYHGAFRSLRLWHLETNSSEAVLRVGADLEHARRCKTRELLSPDGRCLVLVVSDCVSRAWHTGSVSAMLQPLCVTTPLAVLQMLPQRMWRGSALGRGTEIRLGATLPGAAAVNLPILNALPEQWEVLFEPAEQRPPQSWHLPVLTLEADVLLAWANVLNGKQNAWLRAVQFDAHTRYATGDRPPLSATSPEDVTKLLQRFYADASPNAQQLAGYLAAVPLTLPIMRLVQQVMLPKSGQTELAEVYVSGLLRKVDDSDGSDSLALYDFHDGIRDRLLEVVGNSEAVTVLRQVSDFVANRTGRTLDFDALLADPTADGDFALDGNARHFATIGAKVLRRLGGEYLRLAERLEGRAASKSPNPRGFITQTQAAIRDIPKEIIDQGPAAVDTYLKHLDDQKLTLPFNRVRAIFIGYGEAGKTSLITAIRGEPVVEGQGDMTPGIEIREWPVEGSNIKAHLWDFGGQVMAHAIHLFFMREHCLYVVVLNARSEINSTEQAEYWLEHVKAFGKSAPVMLVGNKCDQAAIHLDMGYLMEKYPNIVGFYPLSCTQTQTSHKAEFDHFRRDFCHVLAVVGTHQLHLTARQLKVLEELRQYSSAAAFLKHQEYEDICAKYGVGTKGVQNREWLLDIFDKLGLVIRFPQLAYMDEYLLNPRWLTYGIYTLMYARQASLTESDVVKILSKARITDNAGNVLEYPKAKCRFIMDAMQQFKLCYKLPRAANTLIIPSLLPSDIDHTRISFIKQNALMFEFVFKGFLPRHIMPELIVNRHEEIYREIVWQYGVLLKSRHEDAQALVEVDYHNRVLSLWLQGEGRKEYLGIIRDEILKILGQLELDYREQVALPTEALINPVTDSYRTEKAPYRQIVAYAKIGEREFLSESGFKYDLKRVIGAFMSDAEQAKAGINQNSDYPLKRALIFTTLSVEYAAVREHLQNVVKVGYSTREIYERGRFQGEMQTWDVGIVKMGMGSLNMAQQAARTITEFQPEVVLFVGIARGVKDVQVGDVVVATNLLSYHYRKADSGFTALYDEIHPLHYPILEHARIEARKDDWRQRLADFTPQPKILFGPIVTYEDRDPRLFHDRFRSAVATVKENNGFFTAAMDARSDLEVLVVLGISNLGTDYKHDSRDLASRHAAAFAFEVLAKLNLPPLFQASESQNNVGNKRTRGTEFEHEQMEKWTSNQIDNIFLHKVRDNIKFFLSKKHPANIALRKALFETCPSGSPPEDILVPEDAQFSVEDSLKVWLKVTQTVLEQARDRLPEISKLELLAEIKKNADIVIGWIILLCVAEKRLQPTKEPDVILSAVPDVLRIPVKTKFGAEVFYARSQDRPARFNFTSAGEVSGIRCVEIEDIEMGLTKSDSVKEVEKILYQRIFRATHPKEGENWLKRLNSKLEYDLYNNDPSLNLTLSQNDFTRFAEIIKLLKTDLPRLQVLIIDPINDHSDSVFLVDERRLEVLVREYLITFNKFSGESFY